LRCMLHPAEAEAQRRCADADLVVEVEVKPEGNSIEAPGGHHLHASTSALLLALPSLPGGSAGHCPCGAAVELHRRLMWSV